MNKFLFLIAMSLVLMSQKCDESGHDTDGSEHSHIMIKTTACFGTCPIYTFKITNEGDAIYDGQKFVAVEGQKEKKFTKKQVEGLFQAFENGDFWSYKDKYTANVTDLPSTYLTYSAGGKTKTIQLYYEVPEKLRGLSKLVKSFANSEGWVSDDSKE